MSDQEPVYGEEALSYAMGIASGEFAELQESLFQKKDDEYRDPAKLADFSTVSIEAGMNLAKSVCTEVERQMAADDVKSTRGKEWRRKAARAHRYHMWVFYLLKAELNIRKSEEYIRILGDLHPEHKDDLIKAATSPAHVVGAVHDAMNRHRQREAWEAKKTLVALTNERHREKDAKFVMAANEVLAPEQRRAIWDKAMQDDPDNDCWRFGGKDQTRITAETAREIREAYEPGQVSFRSLAVRFGVGRDVVKAVLYNELHPDASYTPIIP